MNALQENLLESINATIPPKPWEEMTNAEFTGLYPYLDPEDRFL